VWTTLSTLHRLQSNLFIFLFQIHQIFRTSGATIEKAQKEFAQGVASNKAVQKAAVDTTVAGISGQP